MLAWPIILSNVTTPLLGLVDTAVVGRLPGPHYIGAVAIGAASFSLIFWLFGFLRMGTSGFTAQAFGAGDTQERLAILMRATLLAAALGLVLILLQGPLWWVATSILEPTEAAAPLAAQYFDIRIWTAPAALTNYAVLGWLIGMQKTRLALYLQLWLNGVNIVLDLVFVSVLEMGVPGVAWATFVGEWSAALLGLLLAFRLLRPDGIDLRAARILDPAKLRAFFSANLDIMIRTLCLTLSFAWFTRLGGQFGDLTFAANAVLMQLVHMMAYGLDGFAFAAEALVGAAIGARDRAALRLAVVTSTILAAIISVLIGVAYWLFGAQIIALITTQAPVQNEAAIYLVWVATYPLIAVWCFQLDGIFIGATRTAEMRNGMLAAMVAFMVAAHILPDMLGNHGLWLSLVVLNVCRSGSLLVYYRRIEKLAAPLTQP